MHAIRFLLLFIALQAQPTGTVSGRVTFEDSGAPASDVAIRCVARDGPSSEQVLTDGEGRYVCNVASGVYRVRAELSRLDTFYLPQIYGTKAPGDEGLGIRVRAGARLDVPFVLKRSGTISGRVVDSDAVPLRDAVVTVFREPTDPPSLGVRPIETAVSVGDSGRFTISGLVPGSYRIRVEPPEYRTASDQDGRRLVPTWYPAATDPRHAIPVQINGDELGGVDLVVTRSRLPVVSGRVVRADGRPASGIQIRLVAAVGANRDDGREEGRFVAEGLPAGTYHVIALATTPAGFLQAAPHVLRSLTLRATRVTLGDGDKLAVQLQLVRPE